MIRTLRSFYFARPRLIYALALGVAAGLLVPIRGDWVISALIGWNVAVYLYLAFIWTMMIRADHDDVKAFAARQDEKAYVVLTAASLAAIMSVAAIVLELATSKAGVAHEPLHIVLTASTVIGSWFLIPTIFGLNYAHLYYRGDNAEPLLNFPGKGVKPDYWDFMYFSFTIAVASQTADVTIASHAIRKSVLAQAVLSFFFNASILALSINIGASLVAGG